MTFFLSIENLGNWLYNQKLLLSFIKINIKRIKLVPTYKKHNKKM